LLNIKRMSYPNLALMKISAYHKQSNDNVRLILNYSEFESLFCPKYDKIYISKIFSWTKVPEWLLHQKNVVYNGTGFYYDKAKFLPKKIEMICPDYDLYSEYIELKGKTKRNRYYHDANLGFTTRGCFRKCSFCINKRFSKAFIHSDPFDFVKKDNSRTILLDDNVLAYKNPQKIFNRLDKTGIPYLYNQGLDIRLITESMAKMLHDSNHEKLYTFAYDDSEQANQIESGFKLFRKIMLGPAAKCFVLTGFDKRNKYQKSFYEWDIIDTWDRVIFLIKHKIHPFIMIYNNQKNKLYPKMIQHLKGWCNQYLSYSMCFSDYLDRFNLEVENWEHKDMYFHVYGKKHRVI